jgi:hypothetical protein
MDVLKGAMKDSVSSAVLPPGNPLGALPLGKPVDVEAIVKDVKGGIVEVASGFTPQKVAFEIGGMVFIWFQGLINSRKKAIEVAKLERHQYNSFIFDIAKKAWTGTGAGEAAAAGASEAAASAGEAAAASASEAAAAAEAPAEEETTKRRKAAVEASALSEEERNTSNAPLEVAENKAPVEAVRAPNNNLSIREPSTQQKENAQ